jgi:hypothetical protein
MFYSLHRHFREIIIQELQNFINEYPYYSTLGEDKFQQAPVIVTDAYSFNGRQFPTILVENTSSDEFRMAMDKFCEETRGHVRIGHMLPTIFLKAEDDLTYTGVYTNSVYKLEFVNLQKENLRDIQLRVTSSTAIDVNTTIDIPISNSSRSIYVDSPILESTNLVGWVLTESVTPEAGEYCPRIGTNEVIVGPSTVAVSGVVFTYRTWEVTPTKTYYEIAEHAWRTDIIPGARLYFGSYNTREPGKASFIETFRDAQFLGDTYMSGYNLTFSLKVMARAQVEAQELIDLVNSAFLYLLPQRLFNGHGMVIKDGTISGATEKDGEKGEETFSATYETTVWTEAHMFVPYQTISGYSLWLEMRDAVNTLATADTEWKIPTLPRDRAIRERYNREI